jgi:hypothetical protein
MIKKLVLLFIFLLCSSLITIYLKEYNISPPICDLENRKDGLGVVSKELEDQYRSLIQEINEKNAYIQSFLCNNGEVRFWEGNQRFKLKSTVNYCKPFGFRMQIHSLMGKELDLGSNDKIFWYWSKRDRLPGVYWAIYEDFQKTRLKTPFNPIFIRSTFGLEKIELENAKIADNNVDLTLTYPQVNSVGDRIWFSILINKERKEIDGFLIFDKNGQSLAVCEIQSRVNNFPNKILYLWKEENRSMSIVLKDPKINIAQGSDIFQMPEYSPKINMADE